MVEQSAHILANDNDVGQYFRMTLRADRVAPLVQPGQFVHLKIPPLREALLRRPFSIYQATSDTLSILYKTVGKGTTVMSQMRAGDQVNLLGPLGNGFTLPQPGGHQPWLVAGGYGMAAMYLLAQRSPQKGIVFVGGRTQPDILCVPEFTALGWEVRIATEDGSLGVKGLVTLPLLAELNNHPDGIKLFACGPNPMLKAVTKIAAEYGVPAEISVDEHMCCGMGVCLACVIKVRGEEGWEYQRTCTEGPVFDARKVAWEEMA